MTKRFDDSDFEIESQRMSSKQEIRDAMQHILGLVSTSKQKRYFRHCLRVLKAAYSAMIAHGADEEAATLAAYYLPLHLDLKQTEEQDAD